MNVITTSQNPHNSIEILQTILDWSRKQQWRGYNKHDGLNSPILNIALGWNKWTRIFATQGVMRFPINIRPLLFVPKVYNHKGLSLFIQALLDFYDYTGDEIYLEEAKELLTKLLELKSPGPWHGACWGYLYPWQDLGFFAPSNTPNAVVTSFVCEALLRAHKATNNPEYLDVVSDSISFFLKDLQVLKDTENELCLSYMPLPMTMRVMDVSALISSVMIQHDRLSKSEQYKEPSNRLMNYVIKQQTKYGAWFYTDPPRDSPIRHDNYHTGFILDAIQRYLNCLNPNDASPANLWHEAHAKGLKFYAEHLFSTKGAPRWMSDREYPYDIHGAAQGILTFSQYQSQYSQLAERILQWSIDTMYHPSGRFYYQQNRYYTKSFTLLRWCNAWMAHAIARFLINQKGHSN